MDDIGTSEYFDRVSTYREAQRLTKSVIDDWYEVSDKCWDENEECTLPIEELPLSSTFIASQDSISGHNFNKIKKSAAEDAVFPPILVIKTREGYLVRNGHHRLCAHRATSRDCIRAYVIKKEMPAT